MSVSMPDIQDGTCVSSRIDMAVRTHAYRPAPALRLVCVGSCPAFFACARWVDFMVSTGMSGDNGVFAGTTPLAREKAARRDSRRRNA